MNKAAVAAIVLQDVTQDAWQLVLVVLLSTAWQLRNHWLQHRECTGWWDLWQAATPGLCLSWP